MENTLVVARDKRTGYGGTNDGRNKKEVICM